MIQWLNCVALYCIALACIPLFYIALPCIVLPCNVLPCIELNSVVLYCINQSINQHRPIHCIVAIFVAAVVAVDPVVSPADGDCTRHVT